MQEADSFLVACHESDQNVACIPDLSLEYSNLRTWGESGLFFGTKNACPQRQIAAKLVRAAASLRNIKNDCPRIDICLRGSATI